MRSLWIFVLLFAFPTAGLFAQEDTVNDPQAYILYKQGNDRYKVKKYDEARGFYLELINQYPKTKYVPYSLYMLSFMETDYIRVIDYLGLIKEKYTDFRYWTNAVEKLGDVFYVMGNHKAAIEQYQSVDNDRAFYMLAMIFSADNLQDQAMDYVKKLLDSTRDYSLAYKGLLIRIKILLDRVRYDEAYPAMQEALKIKKWAFDNGSRVLFYAGKYYYLRRNVVKHFEKSLYIFSLLKTVFPLSVESSMANTYLENLRKMNVVKNDAVRWISDAFVTQPDVPFKQQTLPVLNEIEQKAEKVSADAEGLAANMVKADVVEYVVRIGEYKDLSVANLVAKDLIKTSDPYSLGIYYRNDLYYAEIRGVKTVDEAKDIAKKLVAMGYNDTKVVEFVKVVEYAK